MLTDIRHSESRVTLQFFQTLAARAKVRGKWLPPVQLNFRPRLKTDLKEVKKLGRENLVTWYHLPQIKSLLSFNKMKIDGIVRPAGDRVLELE